MIEISGVVSLSVLIAGLVSLIILKEGSRAVENRYTIPILPSYTYIQVEKSFL